jgi:hypothetical protein
MPETIIMDASTFAQASGEKVDVNQVILSEIPPNFGIQEISIYIYNISGQRILETAPPNTPRIDWPACKKGDPWRLVGTTVHPYKEKTEDQNGNVTFAYRDGFKEVTKVLNPANPGVDQGYEDGNPLNVKRNLNAYGVFWSRNYPPTNEELFQAKERMEKTYRAELEKMSAIESRNPDEARAVADWTSHAAADYFGVSTSWHRTDLIPKSAGAGKVACGACGEDIFATAKICRHCGAPTDAKKQALWLEEKTAPAKKPKEAA